LNESTVGPDELSEGKALSNREEAVLQGLEIMTRHTENKLWLKVSTLRDKVRELLGYDADQMDHIESPTIPRTFPKPVLH
jgi:hypothetical protein